MPTRNQFEVAALFVSVDEELVSALAFHVNLTFSVARVLKGEASDIHSLFVTFKWEGRTTKLPSSLGDGLGKGAVHINIIQFDAFLLCIQSVGHQRLHCGVGAGQTYFCDICSLSCQHCR